MSSLRLRPARHPRSLPRVRKACRNVTNPISHIALVGGPISSQRSGRVRVAAVLVYSRSGVFTMVRTLTKRVEIGPEDAGRAMSLEEFDRAMGREGYRYELNKGVIEVTDVPDPSHFAQIQEIRDSLAAHRLAHPGSIHSVTGSNDSKILLATDQSKRHPDVSVYLTAPPAGPDVWSRCIPAIVVEVVSKRSMKRDYQDKPAEYLSFGVDEYWIVDSAKSQMMALTRWRGQWKEKIYKPTQRYSTPLLPGFSLELKRVLSAGK